MAHFDNHQIFASTLQRTQGQDFNFAWILNKQSRGGFEIGRFYWCKYPKIITLGSSAAIHLIQSVFEKYQDQSLFLLRQKIHCSHALKESDQAFVKLMAKSVTSVESQPDQDEQELAHFNQEEIHFKPYFFLTNRDPGTFEYAPRSFAGPQEVADFFQRWLRRQAQAGPLHQHNRPVIALLLSPAGEPLEIAISQSSRNRTLHAEVQICQVWVQRGHSSFPEGARLYVSHKPCKMCAALIDELCHRSHDFEIHYFLDDGPLSQRTALDDMRSKRLKKVEIPFSWTGRTQSGSST